MYISNANILFGTRRSHKRNTRKSKINVPEEGSTASNKMRGRLWRGLVGITLLPTIAASERAGLPTGLVVPTALLALRGLAQILPKTVVYEFCDEVALPKKQRK